MRIDKEVWQIWTWPKLLKERKAHIEHLKAQLANALPAQEELVGLKELYARTFSQLQSTAAKLEVTTAMLNQCETDLLRCRLDGEIVKTELEKTRIALERAKLDLKTADAEHAGTKGGLIKVLEWIHATHRLSAPPQGIRAILAKANRLSVFLLLLFPMLLLAQPAPLLRNSWSTNAAGTPVQGLDNLSVTNLSSGTNWLFYGILPQTVARLVDIYTYAGETNYNGEASVTNATRMGLVYGKSNNTNLLRSIQGGNGILNTNQGTNLMFAIDPAVVASQANLTAASNSLYNTSINGLTNKIDNQTGRGTNTTLVNATNTTGAITAVPETVIGITGMTTNLFEVKDTNGVVQAAFKSNQVMVLPAGTASIPSIGWLADDDGSGTGFYRPAANNVGVLCNGVEFQRVTTSGTFLGANVLAWGSSLSVDDTELSRTGVGVLTFASGSSINAVTNRILSAKTGQFTVSSPTNAEWLELGYDGAQGWAFLRSQKGSSNGTARPLALGANGTGSDILINTNHSVFIAQPLTNASTIFAPTNTASFGTVTPSGLFSLTIGKGWTNTLGARADMVISVTYNDTATGDPKLAFTNSVTGEAWTNSVVFGLTASVTELLVVPDISPSDSGSFSDISGTGATVVFNRAWWKLK